MNRLIFSAYQKPKSMIFIRVNYDLVATILSILSYSLIVGKVYLLAFIIGFIASAILIAIMYKKKSTYLVYMYFFFLVANLVGILTS